MRIAKILLVVFFAILWTNKAFAEQGGSYFYNGCAYDTHLEWISKKK